VAEILPHTATREEPEGIWLLPQANIIFSLFGPGAYLLYAGVLEADYPILLAIGWAVLAVCFAAFNVLGILNVIRNEQFEFSIDEDQVRCTVPFRMDGQSFCLPTSHVEKAVVASASEVFRGHLLKDPGHGTILSCARILIVDGLLTRAQGEFSRRNACELHRCQQGLKGCCIYFSRNEHGLRLTLD
jgi:hypothetical protein